MKNKILYITYDFPPAQTMGARRAYNNAQGLIELGNEVYILTFNNISDKFDDNLFGNKVTTLNVLDIKKIIDLLQNSKITRSISKLISFMIPHNLPDFRNWFWKRKAVKISKKIITKNNINIIYSSYRPAATIQLAYKLKLTTNIVWIQEFRDLWRGNPYTESNYFLKLYNWYFEKKYISNADGLVTVSSQLQAELASLHKKEVSVIYNGYDQLDSQENRNNSEIIRILYSGSIYPGKRDPDLLFVTLKKIKENNIDLYKKIRVDFYGPNLPKQLQSTIRKYELEDIISLNESISHKEIIIKQREADILLLLGWNHPDDAGVVTGKLFEYLGRQKFILAIAYPYGAIAEILNETESGKVFTDSEDLYNFLIYYISNYYKNTFVNVGNEYIRNYSRKAQVENLNNILSSYN